MDKPGPLTDKSKDFLKYFHSIMYWVTKRVAQVTNGKKLIVPEFGADRARRIAKGRAVSSLYIIGSRELKICHLAERFFRELL